MRTHATQRKNKSKQSTKIRWRPYAKRTHDYKITINDNKEDLRKGAIIYHKSASDEGALTMMCEKDEGLQPKATTRWRIIMACACCKAMDACCR